ncbi:UNKNOWN [Stylonychia lemnae]|uniref:Uncharacterized protein n=1 Tax=Stylonychia lemnae TaxID=5949 RepID=A0A078BBE7_STYLE|nr:UNKNOWN [Stylonychia lemnae]|eukprot:CDW91724.1 UNKNOWN [Stylonychia lemnae]
MASQLLCISDNPYYLKLKLKLERLGNRPEIQLKMPQSSFLLDRQMYQKSSKARIGLNKGEKNILNLKKSQIFPQLFQMNSITQFKYYI